MTLNYWQYIFFFTFSSPVGKSWFLEPISVVAFSIMVLVFILEHLFTGFTLKAAVLGSGLGAVLFGLAVLRARNIALSIGLHFGWNLTHWALGFKNSTGLWVESVAKGSEHQSENIAFIAYTIVMLLGILIVYKLSKKTSFQGNNSSPID